MVKLRNGGDRWFVALAACLGVGLLIFLGQLELVRLSYIRLNEYRDNLLSHSVNVAQSGRNTLVVVNSSREVLCSDDNITTLRRLAFKAHYLRDIGRIKDNRIICTALWGRLAIPVELPAWDREAEGGHRLWAKASGIGKHLEPVDMVARGSGIVFTSPVAFALYENPEQNLSAHVLTRNGKYIYRTFGAAHELTTQVPEQLAWYDLRSRRIVSSCSEDIDICVIAALSGVSLFQQPTSVFLALVAFGAIAGGGLGVAAIRWRRGYSSLPQQIKRAISEGRINVVYQPLVAFKNGRVQGAEVLARLTDEHGDQISPDVFIMIAEQQGDIKNLTRIVIRKSLEEMRSLLQEQRDFYLSLNLSVEDVVDPKILSFLDNERMRLGISASQIVLEITERSTTHHEQLIEGMRSFRARGYEFFIDDFGTGYSNLAYLAKLPISGIKIDRMFTQAIGTEAVSSEIVENVCNIAARLELKLVVEGVETSEQANYVLEHYSEAIGQGWLFGRPVPVAEFCSNTVKH
ncbi:EAL domain-containing protein [Brucella gallinifaecis]|uniref:EAL domain-containing protein n=1 Tax=Brucella gallinifaecis TaxID=215590 RepID=UPI0023615834|nr:EAL domain-containing protein [Brucella gallinifaecis]